MASATGRTSDSVLRQAQAVVVGPGFALKFLEESLIVPDFQILDAAEHAIRFWTRVGADDRVSRDFRRLANAARDRVARSRDAAAPKLRR